MSGFVLWLVLLGVTYVLPGGGFWFAIVFGYGALHVLTGGFSGAEDMGRKY